MAEKEKPISSSSKELVNSPRKLILEEDPTETIEVRSLFTTDVTSSGSFDIRGEIWATTFGKVIQAMPVPVLLVDDSWNIIGLNQAWGRLSPEYEEMLNAPFSSLFPNPTTADMAKSLLEQVLSSRKTKIGEAILEIAKRRTWGRMTFRSIRIMDERFILVLVEDLTVERKQLQTNEKLREELKKLVEQRTAQLVQANAALEKEVTERKRAEQELLKSHDRLEIRVEARTVELRLANEQLKQEMAQREKVEEALIKTERFRAVADLAGGIAHNFRNMLQAVLASASMLRQSFESGRLIDPEESLETIIKSCQSGTDTVNRLHSLTNPNSDLSSRETAVFDLSRLAETATEITKPWWKNRPEQQGIAIRMDLVLTDGCRVRGAEGELLEVLVNLIKNAAETLPEGGTISITTAVQGEEVVLQISDTGTGIRKEHIKKVFDPFWTTKGEKGTGLGLFVSYAVVLNHNGTMSVDSELGSGTTFTVTLPSAPLGPQDEECTTAPPLDLKGSILVVDDMEPVAFVFKEGLAKSGHTVFTALSGPEALEVFERERIDVVVCDLTMPGMDGWEVARALDEICRKSGVPRKPFVLTTGRSGQILENDTKDATCVDRIVEKPTDLTKLRAVVRDLLQERAAAES